MGAPAGAREPPLSESLDWSGRYRSGNTPWDIGAPHPELVARLAARSSGLVPPRRNARALVPGCGRGHDALALARAGWRVDAIDLAPEVEAALRAPLEAIGGELFLADALAWRRRRRYALVFEHTFFCALDPALRPDWGALVRRSLAQGGWVHALVFPVGKPSAEGGPPFGVSAADMLAALGPGFELVEDAPVGHAVERRAWPERYARLRRSAARRRIDAHVR